MVINMLQFGTGGWRAIIGEEFTKENIQRLALALSLKMKEEGVDGQGIVAGYDRRFLSKEAVIWACEIFAAQGIRVWFVNRSSPTPLIMFYVMKHQLDYGFMVTASHNPAIYNGIKVFTRGGRDADEKQTKDIEEYLKLADKQYELDESEKGQMPPPSYLELVKQGRVKEIHPLNEYLDNIINVINMEAIRARDLKVAIDPMFGVSLTALNTILSVGRCTIETINSQHDTLFGGKMPAPTEHTLRNLQNYVLDKYCDIGIATDGDADRLGVIDDLGNFLHPNEILVMLYYYLLKPLKDGELEEVISKITQKTGESPSPVKIAPNPAILQFNLEKHGKSKYVEEAIQYIHAHYQEDITISVVADYMELSEGYLSRMFKKETDYTFTNYLTYYRIRLAMNLLKDCRVKVYEVADRIGYSDTAYFSAQFKKIVGLSPSEYQDRSR